MTFYQELQLNQAGSKAMVKNAKSPREKLHHTCIYMFKIGITLLFCMAFVMAFGRIFGDGNSTVGVVVLLFLMVFKNADFGICMRHSLKVMAAIFGILIIGPRLANMAGPVLGMVLNIAFIFLLAFIGCHNIIMSNHSTVILGYLLLYGYDVTGKDYGLRIAGLVLGAVLTGIVFYRGHRNYEYKRDLKSIFEEFDIHSSRTRWQIAMTLGVSSAMCFAELLHFPRSMWIGIAVMSVMVPFEQDLKKRTKGRIPGNLFGGILFVVLYVILPPSFLSYAGIIGGIGVGLSASYGWQSVFNSLGAMAVATGLLGLPAAVFFRIFHNVCGSIYGHLFYRFFNRSVNCIPAE